MDDRAFAMSGFMDAIGELCYSSSKEFDLVSCICKGIGLGIRESVNSHIGTLRM